MKTLTDEQVEKLRKHLNELRLESQYAKGVANEALDILSAPDAPLQKTCPRCNGDGYTSEHSNDPRAHDTNMGCNPGYCPVQVQCEHCSGTGRVSDVILEQSIRADERAKCKNPTVLLGMLRAVAQEANDGTGAYRVVQPRDFIRVATCYGYIVTDETKE